MRAAVLLLAPLVAGAAAAQAPEPPSEETGPPPRVTPAQARADSVRALRSARSAQAEFERIRFASLPWANHESWGGHCDEIIGRFCLRYTERDDEDDWMPPPEAPRVTEARQRLIARLDSLAALAPGDEWVAGQRVRYLAEAGRTADAAAAARDCAARTWWCLALEGFARHHAGEYAAAEAAFDSALGRMEERRRREWTDLAPLLRPGEGGAYARTRGSARTAAERRFWWFSDPLWMDGGNDRRTEHLSRWVWDRLQDRARSTDRVAWGEDLEQIVVRFGLPVGWQRIRPRVHDVGPASVITHYAPRAREFLPPGTVLRPSAPLDAATWNLFEKRSRTDYAPAYVTHFDSLPHQIAVFRRGAGAVVVAGFEMNRDSVRPSDVVEAGLVLAVDEVEPMLVQRARVTGPAGAVRVATPRDSVIVSVEAIARERKRAARARYPTSLARPVEGGLGISDLLLLSEPTASPRTLDDAWPQARPTVRYRPGERVGLFWEVYRMTPGADTLQISVSLSRPPAGGLRALAERIGLAGGGTPVRVRWSEEAGASPVLGRALVVALPARLSPGEYHLELTVDAGEGRSATRTRSLFVER